MTAGDVYASISEIKPRSSLVLSGSDDLSCPDDPFFNLDGLTISCWVRRNDTTTGVLLGRSAGTDGRVYLSGESSGQRVQLKVYTNSNVAYIEDTNMIGKWVHFTGVHEGSGKPIKAYMNGILKMSANSETGTLDSEDTSINIGSLNGSSSFINASCSELKIWSRPLTDAEVMQNYLGSSITTGLIHYWSFRENFIDSVGGNDGTVGAGYPYITESFNGKRSAVFNGTNAYLQTTALSHPHQNTPSSMAFWIKANDTSTQQNIITQGHATLDRMAIGLESNKMEMAWYNGSFTGVATIAYTSNNWNHIVYTYDGAGTGKCYLNGVLQSATTGNPSTSTSNFTLGASGAGSNPLKGCLADVQIWSRVLSADEALLVSQGNAVNQGLIHQYKFNRDVTDSVGGKDLTNVSSNVKLTVVDEALARVIGQLYTSANDKKLLTCVGGQLLYVRVEEAA